MTTRGFPGEPSVNRADQRFVRSLWQRGDCLNYASVRALAPALTNRSGLQYFAHCALAFAVVVVINQRIFAAASPKANPKLQRLLDRSWEPAPDAFDATVYRKRLTRPIAEENIRKIVQDVFEQGVDWNDPVIQEHYKGRPELRKQELKEAVAHAFDVDRNVRYLRERFRIKGERFRVDQVFQDEDSFGTAMPFTNTYINAGRLRNGFFESVDYDYARKTAARSTFAKTPTYKREEIWRFGSIGLWNSVLIRAATARRSSRLASVFKKTPPNPVRDDEKCTQFVCGTHPQLEVRVREVRLDDREADRFELRVKGFKHLKSVFWSARNDCSRVYRIEMRNPKTGELQQLIRSDRFGKDGFPRWHREETYYEDGFVAWDEWQVEEVKKNPQVPDAVFEFHVPQGFTAVEENATEMTIREPNGAVRRKPLPRAATAGQSLKTWLLTLNIVILAAAAFMILRKALRKHVSD